MKKYSYYRFFRNFSTRTKSDIINLLREGPRTVGDITHAIGGDQSKISHNLKELRDCSVLKVKQQGRKRVYSLNERTVAPMLELAERHVRKHCLGGCRK